MLRFLLILLMGLGLAAVVALSLEPSPKFQKIAWIPKAVGEWANYHENFRHFPGYFLLTALTLAAFAGASSKRIFAWSGGLILLAGILELAQLWLPKRSCDFADFAYGTAGVLAATLIWFIGVWIWAKIRGLRQS